MENELSDEESERSIRMVIAETVRPLAPNTAEAIIPTWNRTRTKILGGSCAVRYTIGIECSILENQQGICRELKPLASSFNRSQSVTKNATNGFGHKTHKLWTPCSGQVIEVKFSGANYPRGEPVAGRKLRAFDPPFKAKDTLEGQVHEWARSLGYFESPPGSKSDATVGKCFA